MTIRKQPHTVEGLHTPSTVGGGGGVYLREKIDEKEMKKIIDDRIGIRTFTMMNILLIHGRQKPAGVLCIGAPMPKSQIRNPDQPHTFFRLEPETMTRLEAFFDKYEIHWIKKEAKSDDRRRTVRHPDGWIIYERERYDYFFGQDSDSATKLSTAEMGQEYGHALGFPRDAVDEFTGEIDENIDDWKTGEDWELYSWWKPAEDITSSQELSTRWMHFARKNYPQFASEFETYQRHLDEMNKHDL
jgi:hypothetical protein